MLKLILGIFLICSSVVLYLFFLGVELSDFLVFLWAFFRVILVLAGIVSGGYLIFRK